MFFYILLRLTTCTMYMYIHYYTGVTTYCTLYNVQEHKQNCFVSSSPNKSKFFNIQAYTNTHSSSALG